MNNEQQLQEVAEEFDRFKTALLDLLSSTLNETELRTCEDHEFPDGKRFVSFTFFLADEIRVDNAIRICRDKLLTWPSLSADSVNDGFIYMVNKSHIQSHDYWSVDFWLSDRYELTESSQP